MPGMDGTGPNGMGPMTGGGFGVCAQPDNAKRGAGLGRGRGFGRRCGRGYARNVYINSIPQKSRSETAGRPQEVEREATGNEEVEALRQEKQALEAKIAALNATVEELKAAQKPKNDHKKPKKA